jgi:hypothetical protein
MDNIYLNINFSLIFVNFLLCMINFNKLGKAFKILCLYMGFICLFVVLLKFSYQINIHSFFVSHIFFLGQFFFLSTFYYEIMRENFQKKIIFYSQITLPILLIIQYLLHPELLNKFNLFEIYSISFLIIVFVLFHFYDMLNVEKYFFYNSVAILLYQLGTVILYSTGNLFLEHNPKLNLFTFDLINILGIITQGFAFLGWRNYYKTRTLV